MDFFYHVLIFNTTTGKNMQIFFYKLKAYHQNLKIKKKSSQFFFCYWEMLIFNKIKNILVFLSHKKLSSTI